MTDKSKQAYELLAKDHPTPDEFKLLLEHMAPGVLAKRYLASGLPYVFRDQPHKYLAFREAAGRIFDVPPQQIAVMGSARFGFSTSPKKQTRDGAKVLDENSDMDLVVISPNLYQRALESFATFCFDELRSVTALTSDAESPTEDVKIRKNVMLALRRRSKALFFGYVSPNDLADRSIEKQQLYDMLREAGTQLFGTAPPGPINRVSARIYRDWDSAERAYEFSFGRLAKTQGIPVSGEYTALALDEDISDAE
jgi:hypothetical protein